MNGFFLKSQRLGLRHWQATDILFAVKLWANPQVTQFISSQPLTGNDVQLRLDREIESQRNYGIQYWPVFLLHDSSFVGCCGLRPRAEAPEVPEFGAHLLPEFWRRGYAVEAAKLVFAYAFRTLGCQALFAGHNPDNVASRGLLTRLGFVHTHDEFYAPTGLMHPSYRLDKGACGT